jgi:hypothetical protein
MGVERGNADLLIFAITGAGAIIYNSQRMKRQFWATMLVILAIILKLFPMFTVALAVRRDRRDLLYAIAISAISIAGDAVAYKEIFCGVNLHAKNVVNHD